MARPRDDLWAPEEEEEQEVVGKNEDREEEAKERASEEEKTTEPVPKQKRVLKRVVLRKHTPLGAVAVVILSSAAPLHIPVMARPSFVLTTEVP